LSQFVIFYGADNITKDTVSNGEMIDEQRTGKDSERGDRGLIGVLSRNFLEETV
jgi:hypothetical protein